MSQTPTPRLILETLFPHLKVAAGYAQQIQSRIATQPAKGGDNFFAAALSDADVSIQTLVEVALLGSFPDIRFYGEEYAQSCNTKYFRSIELGPPGDYLVTLDPIDGTQFYLDGHANYQIILGVLNWDEFEAALVISPAYGTFIYALRGEGAWQGTLEGGLASSQPLKIQEYQQTILLGWGMEIYAPKLKEHFQVIDIANSYSREAQIPNFHSMLQGELAGAILRKGQFIDGAALAFIAQEAGGIVTTLEGQPLPPLHACQNYLRPSLIMANSPLVHQRLLEAVQS